MFLVNNWEAHILTGSVHAKHKHGVHNQKSQINA